MIYLQLNCDHFTETVSAKYCNALDSEDYFKHWKRKMSDYNLKGHFQC